MLVAGRNPGNFREMEIALLIFSSNTSNGRGTEGAVLHCVMMFLGSNYSSFRIMESTIPILTSFTEQTRVTETVVLDLGTHLGNARVTENGYARSFRIIHNAALTVGSICGQPGLIKNVTLVLGKSTRNCSTLYRL